MKNFQESSKLTENYKIEILFFVVALVVLNFLGALAFLVGLLFTVPTSLFAGVHYYRTLSAFKSN